MTKVDANMERVNMAKTWLTNDFLNLEFAFKYGIWEFLIHGLTPETQLLGAIEYGTDLNFLCIRDQLHIIFDICVFMKGCEWENALNLCVAHPLKEDKLQNISVMYDFSLILYIYLSKIKTVACHIAAKSCVSEVKMF